MAAGKERAVRGALKRVRAVKAADLTAGEQDIIAVIEAKSYEVILKTVVSKLRGIKGIQSTSTSLVLE